MCSGALVCVITSIGDFTTTNIYCVCAIERVVARTVVDKVLMIKSPSNIFEPLLLVDEYRQKVVRQFWLQH